MLESLTSYAESDKVRKAYASIYKKLLIKEDKNTPNDIYIIL